MLFTGVWESLYGWREFLLTVAVITILAAILCPIIINKFEYNKGRMTLLYFMFDRSTREIAYICFVLLESVFVLSCVLFQYKINAGVVIMLSLIGLMLIILGRHWKLIIMELASTVFFSLFLLFAEMLLSYNREIRVEMPVTVLYILICAVVLVYILFYVLWHLLHLRNMAEKRKNKLKGIINSGDNTDVQ